MATEKSIGEPSLHDWRYEEFSRRDNARDEALDFYAKTFKSDLCIDFRAGRCEKVDSVMEDVLEGVFNDPPKTLQFCRALFALSINPDGDSRALADLIQKELENVIETEFERAAKERDE